MSLDSIHQCSRIRLSKILPPPSNWTWKLPYSMEMLFEFLVCFFFPATQQLQLATTLPGFHLKGPSAFPPHHVPLSLCLQLSELSCVHLPAAASISDLHWCPSNTLRLRSHTPESLPLVLTVKCFYLSSLPTALFNHVSTHTSLTNSFILNLSISHFWTLASVCSLHEMSGQCVLTPQSHCSLRTKAQRLPSWELSLDFSVPRNFSSNPGIISLLSLHIAL